MRVADLRSILHYVPKFREGVFVLCIDGDVVSSENFANVLLDLAVLRSLNINVVLVHGAARQMEELALRRHIQLSDFQGERVTDEATLDLAIDATSRLLNTVLQGLTTVDLRAASPNAVVAAPSGVHQGIDRRLTGRILRIETRPLEMFLKEAIIPVIPPLGYDGEGNAYRLEPEELSVALGEALRASKVIFLSSVRMPSHDGGAFRNISTQEAEQLLTAGDQRFTLAQRTKLAWALAACRAGIPRAHVLPGQDDGAILNEVFSSEGIGTMVYADDYQHIRPMVKDDIRAVLDLIRTSVDSAELVGRTHAEIASALQDYWVLETDGMIMGVVAMHVYAEEKVGELACLYIRANYTNRGYGRKLIQFVENLAVRKGMSALFALSTQTFSFFEQKGGYKEVNPDHLPQARRRKYDQSKRNSKVLLKTLSSPENALALQGTGR